jgi:hypothetical protein
VLGWLDERAHRSTSEYPTRGPRRRATPDAAVPEPTPRLMRRRAP